MERIRCNHCNKRVEKEHEEVKRCPHCGGISFTVYPSGDYEDLSDRLNNGRHYLMEVEPRNLTVEDCLEAFGFSRNGLRG